MLEEQLAYYLEKYLGNYVQGLSKEALKVSVWQGNVELTNMHLKPEALNALKLPIKVKAGFLGSVKLKVPWSRLGQEPVVVELDRIFVLAEPSTNVQGSGADSVQEGKIQCVQEEEERLLSHKDKDKDKQKPAEKSDSSWLGSLIATVIGNLKLSITNIHIRYEDTESNLGHPFAAGLTLAKLAAVTVDEDGREIFVTGGALDRIQKSAELNRLAFYFDPDTDPWPMEKWEELLPKEWNKVFMPGIKEDPSSIIGDKPEWIQDHQYVLEPVAGTAKYFRLGQKDSRTPDRPPQKAVVILEDVTLSLSEKQYRDAVKLMENISTFKKRVQYAHYRPNVSISADKNAWWKYTYAAITEQRRRASGHLSWQDILKYSKMRKNYVSKYIELLEANPKQKSINKNKEIRELDRQLDPKIIIQWRMLAHTYVEKERAKDVIHQQSKKSWWAFGWGSGSDESNRKNRELTEDDWKQVNEIIGYEEGKPSPMLPDVDLPNMVHSVVEIEMKHNGTRLLSGDRKVCILELTAEGIGCNVKLYPQTQVFDVKLSSYKISCPEGLLGESAMDEKSLYGTFTLHPWDREVDWMLEAKAAPCYVTVLMPSINRVTQFFSSKEAVSQRVALQTAAALQSTVNEVSKNAQHQLNDALKNKPRFFLDLDIDAPKVVIPTEFYPDGKHQCKLFLDLGHFKIMTVPENGSLDNSSQEKELYMRFRVSLSDISAFFVDGEFRWWKQQYSVGGGGGSGSLASMGKKLQLEKVKDNSNNEQKENIDSAADANGHHHVHRDENGNGKKIANENVNVQENHNKATVLVDGKEKSGGDVIQAAGSKRHEEKAAEKEKADIGEPKKMQEGSKIEDHESSTSAEEDEVNAGDLFFLPLLKKTGMVVALEQICVPHPKYPSTRVAIRLPSLGFQFSPARYHRLMQVINVFSGQSSKGGNDGATSSIRPWDPADFEGPLSVLSWKGVGHREATWERYHGALAGPFLYLLESPSVQSYKSYHSLLGKKVFNVPPESVGAVKNVLAVCDSSQLDSKVVESANALLLRFDNDAARENWQARLLGAIHHSSSPAAVAGIIKSGKTAQKDPKEMVTEAAEGHDQQMNPAEQETFFLTGVLDELKFIVSNSLDNDHVSKALLLEPEKPILEFCAIGTKVQFVRRKYDMLVGAVLQSLEVEDKYHGHVSYSCRYLARSYIKHDQRVGKEGQGRRQGQMLLHHRKDGYSDDDDQGGLKALSEQEDKSSQSSERLGRMNSEANDRFFDANDESDRSDGSRSPQRQDSLSFAAASQFYDANNGENAEEDDPPSFKREVGLLPGSASPLPDPNNEDVSQNEELKNFVKAQVIISSQESPEYTNIDKQVRVSLSTLSFYCNRPTIIAILDLVTAINAKFEAPSAATDDSKVDVTNKEGADEPLPSATDDEQQDVKSTSCGSSQEDVNNFDRDDEKKPPKEEDTEFKEQHVSGQASTSTADHHEITKNKDIDPSASDKAGENQTSQSAGNAAGSHVTTIDPTVIEDVDDYGNATIAPKGEDSVVKGLLGKGKERVVFSVALDMELAEIVLNLEDGQQLATLSQNDLCAEVKVFPASWGIKAKLGNLRISDDFIRNQQQDEVIPYPFICDMRDPAGSSFIELEFLSFSKDDIDYKGFEYSITGKLSEVRFVFLYRFIQEITAYFMGLVPQSSGYVMKLKDRATNYEKLFTQSEIEGSPSLKMDLALSNPIIIMPRATYSKDYMELDVQQVNVKSKSEWFGGDKEELGAIRLETITLEVDDVSLEVGVGGKSGDEIIERVEGISLVVRRPLRDLWHQVPGIEATVKIEQLRASLSDKEYQVITECATCNMAEVPNLPPSLFEEKSGEEDEDEEDKEQQANDEAGKLKVSGADDSEVLLVEPDDDADDGEEKKEGGSLSSSGYDKETREKVTHYNQSADSNAVDEPLEHSCHEVIQEGDPLEHKEEDIGGDESSIDKPFTTIKVSVDIKLVELGLYVGGMRTAALATIQVRGVWVAYKSNNVEEMNVMTSLERFSVKDDREGSDPEMRYMIGSADDWVHNPTTQRDPIDDQKPFEEQEEGMERDNNNNPFSDHKMGWCSALTMLVVDAMLGPTQQTVSLRIQRPRVTVAFDFLLAVAEFFVPSMHAMLSDKGDENPLDLTNGIFLDKPTYKQKTQVVEITPKKPLVADHVLVDEYTYDGQGNTLRLLNRTGTDLSDYAPEALIFIGDGKRLSFRNIVIQNGAYLDSSIALGSNSSYSASEDDGVFLEATPNEQLDRNSVKGDGGNTDNEKKKERGNDNNNPPQTKLTIELQAIGPELTLYNSLGRPSEAFFLPESFLRARMNAFVRYTSKGEDMELNANLNTLTIEAKSGITVMEPFNADMSYSKVAGKQNICAKMTEICTNFSFSILHLILRLQDDVMSFMRITSEEMTVECSEFDKIWVSTNWEESKGQQHIAFWRPRPPPGFAVLGDCFTPLNEAPAKGVLALNMALVQVKRAESFELMWSSTKQATSSRQQQLLSTNNNGSERANSKQKAAAAEFGGDEEMDENKLCQDDSSSSVISDPRQDSLSDNRPEYSSSFGLGQQSGISSGRIDYKDLLDSKENDEETDCSIWRPVAPPGYVALGCVACKGQRPPPTTASLCVLAALVSPCSMRDCVYVTSEVNEDLIPDKGWAFWQVDNSAGTFFVEPVVGNEVSMPRGYELRHAIISYTVFPVNETKPSTSTDQPSSKVSRTVSERPQEGQEGAKALMSTTASASSGRMYEHVTEFKRIWQGEGSKFWKGISIWRPVVQPGFAILGDVAVKGYKPPSIGLVLWDTNEDGGGGLFAKPEKFEKQGYLKDDIAFWLPVAPSGYVSLGCVATTSSSPDRDLQNIVRCVRSDLVMGTDFASCITNTSSIKHRAAELSIWPVENKAKTFFVIPAINKRPPADLARCLAFAEKPRKPDNLIANLEVKGISATVSDDFGGLMAPILDFSVTSIQASLHGCMEAFSMETNFALSSSTYNGRYSAWEPLIEPCDAKVRYVYSSDPDEKVQPTVSEITMKLTKDLNMNVSVANINLVLEAYASWTSLSKLEQGSSKQQFLQDQGGVSQRSMSNNNKPMRVGISNKCLDGKQNKRFYIVTHNAMGEPLYVRTIESSGRMHMAFLPAEGMAAIKIPMPRSMKDSAHKSLEKVWPGIFVTIRVGYAELPADKGIGGREYMAGIRIVSSKPVPERMDVPLQSARTRCVHPERETASGQVQVFWDEVFIFEVKPGELSKAEILVMDLTRGIPVGFCSLSLLEKGNELQEDSQDSLLEYGKKQKTTVDTPSWSSSSSLELKSELLYHPPTEKQEQDSSNDESARGDKAIGKLYTSYNFSSITGDEISRHVEGCSENSSDQDGGDQEPGGAIEVAISKQGPWSPVVVNYGLGPAAWHLGKDIFLASEMMVEEMIKHLFVRTMVTVENASEFVLEVRLCLDFLLDKTEEEIKGAAVEQQQEEDGHHPARESCLYLSDVGPNSSISCPLKSLCPGSLEYCLQVRPQLGSHKWSMVVPINGKQDMGKKQVPVKKFRVNALSETEELLCCPIAIPAGGHAAQSKGGGKDVWFCIESKAKEIGKTSQLDPILDWKLTVSAPLQLINHLPVPCRFTLSGDEKVPGEGQQESINLDSGVVNAGKSAYIFHVDLRKALYLYWVPQGGWQPKDAVIISHPQKDLAKEIIVSNPVRDLKIHIQHEREEKGMTAKVIYFYVPCWLDSERCPLLKIRLVELELPKEKKGKKKEKTESTKHEKKKTLLQPPLKVKNVIDEINQDNMDQVHHQTMLSRYEPKMMGLAVALSAADDKTHFGEVEPLDPLDNSDGSVELITQDVQGSYYKFLVTRMSNPYGFAQAEVLCIRPYTIFTNRIGQRIHLRQEGAEQFRTIDPTDSTTILPFVKPQKPLKLQVQLEESLWSHPFTIQKEEKMHLAIHPSNGRSSRRRSIRIDVRGYEDGSRFWVLFQCGSSRGPYRLENRTMSTQIKFRQVGFDDDAWRWIKPHSTVAFAWDNPQGEQLLEVIPDGDTSSSSSSYTGLIRIDINKVGDHPVLSTTNGPDTRNNICIRVLEAVDIKVVRFFDQEMTIHQSRNSSAEDEGEIEMSVPMEGASQPMQANNLDKRPDAPSQFKFVLDVRKLGLSIINHRPQELLFLHMERVKVEISYSSGSSSENTNSGIVLVVGYMQIDNQLPLTPMPVLLAPECKEKEESVLEIVLEMKSDSSEVKEVYPCIGLKTTESAWRLNIHEEMIWVAVEMYSYLRLDRLSSDSDVVQVDPEIQVELLHMSEVRFKLTIETCPEQRPPGKLGIWGPIVSTVGNISKMPVHLHNIMRENRYMRKSQVTTAVVDHIKHDLVHQPLQLLMGINLLGMTSSTLGTMSRGAASLSKDSSYLQMRSNQEKARRVRGVRDGVLQGTSTFARGVTYGVKGIVTKPAEGVRTKGVKGAFQGFAKAIVGVIVQPVSGCLDFGALMVSGVGTSCTHCFAAIEQEPTFERSRLPRAIQGKVLTPYNEHSAQGQAILHLVQSRFLGKDVFRERGQSSRSDYYQEHFYLPQDFILLLTNRHVAMLKPPAARARDPNKELTNPRTIEWKVRWAKLVNPFSSLPGSSSSSLVQLHCQDASNQFTKVIECFQPAEESGNSQALQICEAIQHYQHVFCPDREVLPTAKTRRLPTNMFKHRSGNKKTNLGRKNHKGEEITNCSLKDYSEEGAQELSSNSQHAFQELTVEEGETDSPETNEEIIPT